MGRWCFAVLLLWTVLGMPTLGLAADMPQWLGIQTVDIEPMSAAALGLREPAGVLVTSVQPGTAAHDADIVKTDAILEVNGQKIINSRTLRTIVDQVKPGGTLKCFVLHVTGRPNEPMKVEGKGILIRRPRPGEPRVSITQLAVEPEVVAAGGKFAIKATYGVVNPGGDDGPIPVNYKIEVVKGAKRVTLDSETMKISASGEKSTFWLTAPQKSGSYQLLFSIQYQNISRSKQVSFEIE